LIPGLFPIITNEMMPPALHLHIFLKPVTCRFYNRNSGATPAVSLTATNPANAARILSQADVLVTVCGHADEHCPVLPAGKKKIHWPLSDPAKAKGTEEQIMATANKKLQL
jgi:hypothetical protein